MIIIYKTFVGSPFDYGDVALDQTFHDSFHQRLESIQYNNALVITGAIKEISNEKPYQEFGY